MKISLANTQQQPIKTILWAVLAKEDLMYDTAVASGSMTAQLIHNILLEKGHYVMNFGEMCL